MLIILYFVFFKSNVIKLEPTKPAPPVIAIVFFFILNNDAQAIVTWYYIIRQNFQ